MRALLSTFGHRRGAKIRTDYGVSAANQSRSC